MRVVAGTLRGRRFAAPAGDTTRPTSDRVREAVFSILGDRVQDARVLDLFAGSGALGIEALSRGAAGAVFVERDRRVVRVLEGNLTELGLAGDVRAVDALRALREASARGEAYDLAFLDPPYRQAAGLGAGLGQGLDGLVVPGGRVVTESDRRAPLDLPLPLVTERRYGDTLIRIHEA